MRLTEVETRVVPSNELEMDTRLHLPMARLVSAKQLDRKGMPHVGGHAPHLPPATLSLQSPEPVAIAVVEHMPRTPPTSPRASRLRTSPLALNRSITHGRRSCRSAPLPLMDDASDCRRRPGSPAPTVPSDQQ